jgi:hypothetical protein
MAYTSAVLDGLYVLRWGARPETADAPRFASEIKQARLKQGAPLIAMFIVPSGSEAPSEEIRKQQAALLPQLMNDLRYGIAVFEGEGFVASFKRSVFIAILLLTSKRLPFHVRASVEEALVTKPAGDMPFNPRAALAELRRRGMT